MATSSATENTPELWLAHWPWPDEQSHKHKRGHLGCVTGNSAATGAARLAARSGFRIGAGLVTLFSPPSATLVNAAQSTAVMVKPFKSPDDLRDLASGCDCALIGPAAGVSPETAENTLAILDVAKAAVLDADALTVFKDAPNTLFSNIKLPCVLTPHEGEFNRLFPALLGEHDRQKAVVIAAQRSNATILLKGAVSLIASPDGDVIENRHASPFLATAGSGDVLAGLTGGLMAQGMSALHSAAAACWVHGELARRLGPGLIAEDLPETLPSLLSEFYASRA